MRISDWSSDVCSSDLDDSCRGIDVVCSRRRLHCLPRTRLCRQQRQLDGEDGAAVRVVLGAQHAVEILHDVAGDREAEAEPFTDSLCGEDGIEDENGRAAWRYRVCQYV